MLIPDTEREALVRLMGQVEIDLASAHAEICRLQNLDPATHTWPAWTPQASTLAWIRCIRDKFSIVAHEQPLVLVPRQS